MGVYHKTASGFARVIDSWGHGRAPSGDWYNRPATIVADDGDGHFDAIEYEGLAADAAQTMGRFYLRHNDGRNVVFFSDNRLSSEPTPEDFWVDEKTGLMGDEYTEVFVPNLKKYPNVVAY